MKSGMQWTVSLIRQRTASDRIPVIWTITLQHLRQISVESKINPWTNQLLNRFPDSNAFTTNFTTYDEVQKIILNLRNACSSGHDNILAKFCKPVVDQITSPIAHIINTSIEIFARVCPIPKIDNTVTAKDFPRISILPVSSKIYEKVISSQLLNFCYGADIA